MEAVDSHAHLDFEQFDQDREGLIGELAKQEIIVVNPSSSLESVTKVDQLSRQFTNIFGAIGLHPQEVSTELLPQLPELINGWAKLVKQNKKIVAVGEIGLDYYRNHTTADSQKAALRQLLTFAQQVSLPVIIHCREAFGDLMTLLADYRDIQAVMHCFSGSIKEAEQVLGHGWLISITANITYPKNEQLRQVVKQINLEKIMIETDSPFLSPQESRSKRNDPRNVVVVAQTIAQLKHISLEQVLKATTATARRFFKLN